MRKQIRQTPSKVEILKNQLALSFRMLHDCTADFGEFPQRPQGSAGRQQCAALKGNHSKKCMPYSKYIYIECSGELTFENFCLDWHQCGALETKKRFSQVCAVVIVYRKFCSKPTFEKFCLCGHQRGAPAQKSKDS